MNTSKYTRLQVKVTRAALAAVLSVIFVVPIASAAATTPRMVKDIAAGGALSNPLNLTAVGNTLYFSAKDAKGRELWKSDGTAAHTVRIKDIRVGSGSSNPRFLTAVGSRLFFVATNGSNRAHLWTSDGTGSGTKQVKDINLGTAYGGPESAPISVNGVAVFFRAMANLELWRTDGTTAGTKQIAVIGPNDDSYYGGQLLLREGNSVLIQVAGGGVPAQIIRTNGTSAGTSIEDFTDRADWMIKLNGVYYFSHADDRREELWRSDGTPSGTEIVKDINTLPCTDGCTGTYGSEPSKPVVVNGIMYFTAYDPDFYRYLWRSDGSEGGTVPVAAVEPGDMAVLDSILLFGGAEPGADAELMRSDGTAAGTKLVKRIAPADSYFGSNPRNFIRFGNRVYFTAATNSNPFGDDDNRELYRTDGTKAGTRLVLDINPSGEANPESLTVVGRKLFFTASDGVHGRELFLIER
jgi:ELWxxDGT repeat protein